MKHGPTLTADELLKLQEGRPTKRPRTTSTFKTFATEDFDQSSASHSSSEDVESEDIIEDSDAEEPRDQSSSEDEHHEPSYKPPSVFEDQGRVKLSITRELNAKDKHSSSALVPPAGSFTDMGVVPPLEAALARISIRAPTEIQAACIPPLLAGRDCIGNAKTGSGKTIAFAIPILQKLSEDPYGIFALVLTPTRELAFQISEQFAVLGSAIGVRTSVIVGGMDMMTQALELSGHPHVVVATPGRIVDHLRSSNGEWDLSRVKFLVLDEADRLLTSTFSPELKYLFETLPSDRQTCLFTATLTQAIESLVEAPPRPGKVKPFVHRTLSTVETVATLKQHYVLVPSHVREPYLYHLLCNPPESVASLRRAPPEPIKLGKPRGNSRYRGKTRESRKPDPDEDIPLQPPPTIIFCTKPRTVAYLTYLLQTLSIRSTALHSRLTQRERLTSLSLFRSSFIPVLVSTDVGARGLDIEDVAMVINWDLPNEPEEYTHRVGRTARAGKGGVAISFVTEKDEERVSKIEGRIGIQLEAMTMPENKVLEKLNAVSTAKRVANMELHDSNFGQREEIHKLKSKRKVET
ncbi:P-loop containing nucleoside triphosphate hydrolase protein [Suillus clintonianus]|uniref:P-loop containing nucleoside triphosphate hydrolase protein n=1 Tax=Suillus clintonianus TaxID=1904413 RepID=UPI001B880E64|nr:P-loop containing nucleoside triphosphate hydrolase protein [Suillus clintonianus]KAG2146772.1 P-loop containing nucleoside triphosphate hydrolase protein [Suillus clintonianus]